ncbi:MAG: DUF1127 domain-containing protein [Silicimonas sp.]|nr:DUF1127 domain-containing protein [Silicimonas sp.]MBT8425101.1 DUF1127 domain-containing protein [Silicimonas sp.]NND17209.1 DUF1127 domain-containing protein [Silicimonas sp.]NND22369.1 DUF1127 domain-containing protein [Silicimonas sp.]NND42740.1 DUF1127 domain-containing protein [Silicimonas sp.]
MAFNSQSARSHHQPATAAAVSKFLVQLGSDLAATAKSFLRAMQMARMMSSLAEMSDRQLAEIGITRSQIPQYAEKLLAQETDGKDQEQRDRS